MAATKRPPCVAVRHRPARRRGGPVAVGEVGVAAPRAGRILGRAAPRSSRTAARARRRGSGRYGPGTTPEAAHAGALVAGLEQELVADADCDGRPVGGDPLAQRPIQPLLGQLRIDAPNAPTPGSMTCDAARQPRLALAHARRGAEPRGTPPCTEAMLAVPVGNDERPQPSPSEHALGARHLGRAVQRHRLAQRQGQRLERGLGAVVVVARP